VGGFNEEEMAILRTIYKFPEVVLEAAKNFAPNLICNFLFDLAQKYNNFYNLHPIIKAPSPEIVDFRLALTKSTAQAIKNGLTLLGIEALERM
jgi:arginyl-tRNA synthetase